MPDFLKTLRDLDAKATPGPWTYAPDRIEPDNVSPRDGGTIEDHDMGRVAVLDLTAEDPADGYIAGWRHNHNGHLLVLLRNAAPRIAALVEAVTRWANSTAFCSCEDTDEGRAILDALSALDKEYDMPPASPVPPLPADCRVETIAKWMDAVRFDATNAQGFSGAEARVMVARAVRALIDDRIDGAARQAYRCGYSASGAGVDVTTHIDADVHAIVSRVLGGAS